MRVFQVRVCRGVILTNADVPPDAIAMSSAVFLLSMFDWSQNAMGNAASSLVRRKQAACFNWPRCDNLQTLEPSEFSQDLCRLIPERMFH